MKKFMTLLFVILSFKVHANTLADSAAQQVFFNNLSSLKTQYGDSLESHLSVFLYNNARITSSNTCVWRPQMRIYECTFFIKDNNGITESSVIVRYQLVPGPKNLELLNKNVLIEEAG